MSEMERRDLLKLLGTAPAAAFALTHRETVDAVRWAQGAQQPAARPGPAAYKPKFFTAHEYATVTLLGDLIIPKDGKSGSASDAGTPAFIDYIVSVQPDRQTPIRGGLSWLDAECLKRFDKRFVEATDANRRAVLDDIAYPKRARREFSNGVRFFSSFRDLVATGFWSSQIGVADIGYLGNMDVEEWQGAPVEVLRKLGVSY